MNKKSIRFLFLAIILTLTISVSGCVNSAAVKYELKPGITICPYSDGSGSYGAQVYFYFSDIYSSNINGANEYLFNVLNSEFETTKAEGYPASGTTQQGVFQAIFVYDITIKEEDWFFAGDDETHVQDLFFTAKVSADYANPFALCFKDGTKFNRIYKAFTQRETGPSGTINDYFQMGIQRIEDVTATVLLSATYTLKPESENSGLMYDADYNYHFYYLTTTLKNTPNTRIKYSYSAMQSYAWYILAVVIGLLTVLLVLLLAKKMSGRVVDAKRKKAVQPTVKFVFDPFDNDGPSGASGSGGSGGTSGNGVFDGF